MPSSTPDVASTESSREHGPSPDDACATVRVDGGINAGSAGCDAVPDGSSHLPDGQGEAAEARLEAIERIVSVEKEFCRLFAERIELAGTVSSLRRAMGKDKERIAEMTNRLASAAVDMKSPRVFENKIVIYPIATENADNTEGPY